VARAREVSRVLADRRTTFVVVSTLEAAPLHEAEFFIDALSDRRLHLGALVLNKVLPSSLLDPAATEAAERLAVDVDAAAAALADRVGAPAPDVARVLCEVAESFHNFQVVAKREAEQRAELARAPDVTVAVPYLDEDVHDLAGLVRVGQRLWR
jgi:anion-transporting  ArsA/GET3 family ATPase